MKRSYSAFEHPTRRRHKCFSIIEVLNTIRNVPNLVEGGTHLLSQTVSYCSIQRYLQIEMEELLRGYCAGLEMARQPGSRMLFLISWKRLLVVRPEIECVLA